MFERRMFLDLIAQLTHAQRVKIYRTVLLLRRDALAVNRDQMRASADSDPPRSVPSRSKRRPKRRWLQMPLYGLGDVRFVG